VVALRRANESDLPFIKLMLYEAANKPGETWPPFEENINEPRNLRFWLGWGRSGDIGVVASDGDVPIGAAWIRHFEGEELSPIDDPAIPVLAIGVEEPYRGNGVGISLLGELIRIAAAAGVTAINLTTGLFNEPGLRLYRRYGFEEVFRHEDAVQMRAILS
jgi:ribosomal protein S18 acetylase RimI-like enzyme